MRKTLSLLFLFILMACAPAVQGIGQNVATSVLADGYFLTVDDQNRPLREWKPDGPIKGVVIGVHGFNDYGNFLNPYFPELLNAEGYHLITYDQRGFGESPDGGIFPTEESMILDLFTLVNLVKEEHKPEKLFVLGESMGGAIVAATLQKHGDMGLDGVILSAPAVWGISTYPWYQKITLEFMNWLVPGMSLSGGGIVQPTDNIEVWQAWSRDPKVIKQTRVDSLYGVSQIMETALQSAPDLKGEIIVLYGEKDEVIPPEPINMFVEKLDSDHQFVFYPEGWHMLPRDHQYETVFKDVLAFMEKPDQPLPSKYDQNAQERLKEFLLK